MSEQIGCARGWPYITLKEAVEQIYSDKCSQLDCPQTNLCSALHKEKFQQDYEQGKVNPTYFLKED